MSGKDIPYINTGTAPEFFVSGLHDVEIMGVVVRFTLYTVRHTIDGDAFKSPVFSCVMPLEEVAPAIALTVRKIGNGLIAPLVKSTTGLIGNFPMH